MSKSNFLPLSISLVALLIAILSNFYTPFSSKIVYVDSGLLLDQYQGMVDARADYQKKAGAWQANIDTLQSEVTRAIMDYEKEVSKMTDKEKKLSQELIRTKQKQFQDYQQAIKQQSQQEDGVMTQKVLDKVNAFLQAYGKSKSYKIILGTGQGNIVYAQDGLDITDEVLKLLNDDYLGI